MPILKVKTVDLTEVLKYFYGVFKRLAVGGDFFTSFSMIGLRMTST